jgi:hypothetical protein
MWIDSVRRKILVRPKLVAYLKYGPHVQEKLKETSSTIAGVSNDWQEIRNTGIIFNDFQSVNVNNR